jgi:hypothetical protein
MLSPCTLFIICSTLCFMLNCCEAPSQTNTFTNDRYNYEFDYKSNWTIKDLGQSSVDVLAPDDDNENKAWAWVTINSELTNGKSLDYYFKIYLTDLYSEQEANFKIIREGIVTLNGKKAKWMESEFKKGNTMFKHLNYLIYTENRIFVITCSASKNRFSEYKDSFESIVKSFKIK